MPSLLEELKSRHVERLCRFGRWIGTASKQDRDDLAAALADPTFSGALIAEVLSGRIPGSIVDAIREHRRGGCKTCPKAAEYLNTDVRGG